MCTENGVTIAAVALIAAGVLSILVCAVLWSRKSIAEDELDEFEDEWDGALPPSDGDEYTRTTCRRPHWCTHICCTCRYSFKRSNEK